MSIKRFNADVRAAVVKVKETKSFDVTSVSRGDSDGEFTATFEHPALASPLDIRFLAQGMCVCHAQLFICCSRRPANYILQIPRNTQMEIISSYLRIVKMSRHISPKPYRSLDRSRLDRPSWR